VCVKDFLQMSPISLQKRCMYMYVCVYIYIGNLFDLRECVSRFCFGNEPCLLSYLQKRPMHMYVCVYIGNLFDWESVCQGLFLQMSPISLQKRPMYMYVCICIYIGIYIGNLFDLRECVSRFFCKWALYLCKRGLCIYVYMYICI